MTVWQIHLATENSHKLKELNALFKKANIESIELVLPLKNSWQQARETATTLEENAWLKASSLAKQLNVWSLADDSGLFIEELSGFPGVKSARWQEGSDNDRNHGLLDKMKQIKNRSAYYKAVLCLVSPQADESWLFEGQIDGKISDRIVGTGGFGYDSIFVPAGQKQTFAQLASSYKQLHSHRARAMQKLIKFLKEDFGEKSTTLSARN